MLDTQEEFVSLIRRVQEGDPLAVDELATRYRSTLVLKVRTWMRLRAPELLRVVDSSDICQSVMANFFRMFRAGRCEVNEQDDLLRLLSVMARNEINEQIKRLRAARRDIRREVAIVQADEIPGDGSPSREIQDREQIEAIYGQMSAEERRLADLRMGEHDWSSIAGRLGGTPEARRKQWKRLVQRLSEALSPPPRPGD